MTRSKTMKEGWITVALALCFGLASTAAHANVDKLKIGTKGSEMMFNKTSLTVKAKDKVSLTFTNDAPKDSGMQHNWVLVAPGKADDVSQQGIAAGPDKAYVADSADVLAHTKLLDPGTSETIEFTAPATPGKYPFLCSFPGHYPTMKGTLTVK